MIHLVIGGARSGKSVYAEQCAKDSDHDVIYIATCCVKASSNDREMQQRISHHKASRPAHWQTIEEPIQLSQALETHVTVNVVVIVDCLTLWMTNILSLPADEYTQHIEQFFQTLTRIPWPAAQVIFVSNEVGLGIVPLGFESRRFVDEMGRLHQRLAQICQRVTQITVGIANRLKDE